MARLMRCQYCGLLQDEPPGVKQCPRCGGELAFEQAPPRQTDSYLDVQLELDQVHAPAGQNVDRYLLVTLTAPSELPPEHAAPPHERRPALHFVPVLDVSGSMNEAGKMDYARQALRQALSFLLPGDTFSLVTFEKEVQTRVAGRRFDENARRDLESLISEISARGTTALDGGLAQGIELAGQHAAPTTLVLLLSDGRANEGETDLEKIAGRAAQARQQGVIVSALGMGLDYNEALLSEIANQGGGRFYHIQQAEQIPAALMEELRSAEALAARGVELEFDLPPTAALISLTSLYPAEAAEGAARVRVGDLLRGLRLEIPLRLTLYPHSAAERLSIGGRVRYQSPAGRSLESDLNHVTVRFVEERQFARQPGLVAPVMERVLTFRREAGLLELARLSEQSPDLARRRLEEERRALRAYAAMFNAEAAVTLDEDWESLAAAPAEAKVRLERAARAIRGLH